MFTPSKSGAYLVLLADHPPITLPAPDGTGTHVTLVESVFRVAETDDVAENTRGGVAIRFVVDGQKLWVEDFGAFGRGEVCGCQWRSTGEPVYLQLAEVVSEASVTRMNAHDDRVRALHDREREAEEAEYRRQHMGVIG